MTANTENQATDIDADIRTNLDNLFERLGGKITLDHEGGLDVSCVADGSILATIETDTAKTVADKVSKACVLQKRWCELSRDIRVKLIMALASVVQEQREALATLITLEAGKTLKEAYAEVDGSANVLNKTVEDCTLPDVMGMKRCKERPPVGVVGLITSFNFPFAVANWNVGAALIAGNAVVWKPSEKTPLVALAYKLLFDRVSGEYADLLQVAIGDRNDVGGPLVAHEDVDLISATGSVAMGKGIKETLAKKYNKGVKHILELGGNNGAVITAKTTKEHRDWAVDAILTSFLGTSGQRCTNTRRLFVHRSVYDEVCETFKTKLDAFIASGDIQNPLLGESNSYGYGPLIDAESYRYFDRAKRFVAAQGGLAVLGERLMKDEYPDAYYVEPALAFLPTQTGIMQQETFGPILFLAPYDGDVEEALVLVNEPTNAGLVSAIYTQNQNEADIFARLSEAGHILINSPKGTGTPAYGMGFGGNKDSGEGEILNNADPLQAFTREGSFSRIAQHVDTKMDMD